MEEAHMFTRKKTPTDLEILNAIYERYYDAFVADVAARSAKILVPIDSAAIAAKLGVDPDIVFGRLHYDLQRRYGYKNNDGSEVVFFTLAAGTDKHCVNFPFLASVLAQLREEHYKHRLNVLALVVSIVSLAVSGIAIGN